jgi:hypothetical protein
MYATNEQLKAMFCLIPTDELEAQLARFRETVRTCHPDTRRAQVAVSNGAFLEAELCRRAKLTIT